MSHAIQWWLRRLLVIILIGGAFVTAWSVQHEDARLRHELLIKAKIAASGIPLSHVQSLSGSDADLSTGEYLSLKQQMERVRSTDEKIRFAYIMGKNEDEDIFFYVDSEPPDSDDYSPPGQVYSEATAPTLIAFTSGEELTGGPDNDRWGTWVTGFVPLRDPVSGALIGVFGMDLDARDWFYSLAIAAAPVIMGTVLFLVMVMAFLFVIERKQKEDELLASSRKAIQESEERYRLLFTQSPVGILQVGQDGVILTVNQKCAEILGLPPNDLIGFNIRTQLQNPGLIAAIQDIPRGKPAYYEGKYQSVGSGKVSSVRILVHPLFSEEEGYSGAIAIIEDISDRKLAEEALFQANQKLNLLNTITRHDILNQLLALKGYLELSGDFRNDPEKERYILDRAKKAADTIERHIIFTRDYQDMGVKNANWQKIGMGILRAKGTLPLERLTIITSGLGYEIFADPLLEKVLYNLFENSLKHGGDQLHTIRVSALETDEGLMIVYEDDGVGVPVEVKHSLFEQMPGPQKGLGMYLAGQILGITGITITETGIPGRGARFEIRIPPGGYRREGAPG
ncbi:MAG: PAS domain S-box protein [Methanolinea sp.]|nr:PAS domain S-box protein [Methanolinea sp.]